ncbi:MAG: AMP-binding protein [Opitutales bacterium]
MGPPVDLLEEALERPWLLGREGPVNLRGAFESARKQIREACAEGIGEGVLLCFQDPEKFVAAWLAALAEGRPVFFADPDWGAVQWAQLEEVLAPGCVLSDRPKPLIELAREDCIGFEHCMGIPTGGTGGRVKFALHRWATLAASVKATAAFFQLDAIAAPAMLPLHHVSGLMPLVRALETGGVVRLPAAEETLAEGVERFAAEVPGGCLSLVPTQLQRLLTGSPAPALLEALRRYACIFLGGGPASPELLEMARRVRLPISPVYGMTETASMVAAQRPADFLAGAPLALEPLPHASFETEKGRLVVRADSLFLGYYAELPRPRERFVSGDAGSLTADGRLRLEGRADRILISGGEKVDARRVEAALVASGFAIEALVFGRPDPEWGTVVCALLVAAADRETLPLAEARARLKSHVEPAAVPRQIRWVQAIPRNAANKPDWPAIEALFAAGSDAP